MNVGIMTAYPEPIGFNHGVLQFCKMAQSSQYGITPILIAMTRHPLMENPLVMEARRLGIHVETLHEEFRYDPRIVLKLIKLIDKFDLQILDAQTYKPLALGLIAQKFRKNVSLVSWVHGFTQENLKVKMFGIVESYLHRFSNKVICVSKPFAKKITEKGVCSNKIEIIPNAIGVEEFDNIEYPDDIIEQLGLQRGCPVVGAIGRLSPEKGHTYLIKAWVKIHNAIPVARLVIVGDGPCLNDLQQEVKTLGLQNTVSFVGFRPDGRRFFSIFDVMVLPSLDEGLPYVLLEAIIQNVAVVASAVGEVPEVLENGRFGRLISSCDINAISHNVIELLSDPLKSKELAVEARVSVLARYSHQARVKSINTVYRELRYQHIQ